MGKRRAEKKSKKTVDLVRINSIIIIKKQSSLTIRAQRPKNKRGLKTRKRRLMIARKGKMNCPRLWNLLEIAVMDIGSRTTIHAKKEGLQRIYKQCQKELGFEKIAYDKDVEISELQDKLSRRNMQIRELKKKLEQFRVEKSSLLLICPNCQSKDIASKCQKCKEEF